jgi:prevent-host-death family protein
MQRTNTEDFRTNLKTWMEAAANEPVKITRRSGEAFVLLNADEFEKLQVELANLRGVAKGLNDVVQGRIRKSTDESASRAVSRAKTRLVGSRTKKAAI